MLKRSLNENDDNKNDRNGLQGWVERRSWNGIEDEDKRGRQRNRKRDNIEVHQL